MRTLLLFFIAIIFTGGLQAEETLLTKRSSSEAPVPGRILWRTSIATLAVANAIDVHSSWGKHELNPTLTGPTGNFGRDGALIKLALTGGLIGVEYLVTRRQPSARLYRALSVINFGASSAIGSVAAHNYTVGRPR